MIFETSSVQSAVSNVLHSLSVNKCTAQTYTYLFIYCASIRLVEMHRNWKSIQIIFGATYQRKHGRTRSVEENKISNQKKFIINKFAGIHSLCVVVVVLVHVRIIFYSQSISMVVSIALFECICN